MRLPTVKHSVYIDAVSGSNDESQNRVLTEKFFSFTVFQTSQLHILGWKTTASKLETGLRALKKTSRLSGSPTPGIITPNYFYGNKGHELFIFHHENENYLFSDRV